MPGGLGVVLDSFGQPMKEAIESAARLGFRRIELPAASGPVEPSELGRTGRRHLLRLVRGLGLELSALGGDLGGNRFMDGSRVEERLDRTRAIVELAAELRVPIVTTHLGRLDERAVERGLLAEVTQQLADLADRTGTFVALETGGADPATLAGLLGRVNAPALGVCYDPASLLIEGFEPLAGIEPLASSILIARARDAVAGSPRHAGREVALGAGQLDLPEYLAALDQAGYRNVPFIRRTESEHPLADLAEAKRRLESVIR
ncbi:MAG: sugar phosphate isomerase/epimerase [Planctomycetes bacterium]|nr:sugar phosphate isomerase/epimerase [Planctomycetota bacterium]